MTENEELLKLRELVKIQKEQLEYKDSIITEKDAAITEKDAAITEKDAVIMEKDAAITERDAVIMEKDAVIAEKECIIHEKDELIRKKDIQLENMTQALLNARRKLFGPSTETSVMEGQTTLFDDTQSLASELLKSKKELTVKSHTRTARKPGVRQEMLAGLPTEIEEYIINPEEKCAVCGTELKIVGKRLVRTEVEYIPAKIKVKQIVQQVAKCTKCGTKDSGNPKDHFQSAACENINATFFHYSRSRSGDVPKNLLADFSGYLTTDAYKGYEKSHS